MAWSLKESVEKQSKDPQRRANVQHALDSLDSAQPVESAYCRAILDNDTKAVDKILTSKAIFRAREKAKTCPHEAKYLDYLIKRLKKLESST